MSNYKKLDYKGMRIYDEGYGFSWVDYDNYDPYYDGESWIGKGCGMGLTLQDVQNQIDDYLIEKEDDNV
jgi:hypothetical protein